MEQDILPDLLAKIEQQFDQRTYDSAKLKKALQALKDKRATYIDVNEFAIEIGEILADVFKMNISAEILPDGKMYFNIADRLLNATLSKNHELISNYAIDVQTEMNHAAGYRIKGQAPGVNQNKVDGLINKISDADDFSKVEWLLREPIINFSQSIVDEIIKANVDFHAKVGLQPRLRRRVDGHKPCKWCKSLAGVYDYPDVPDDVYRRHERCRCTVEYNPKDGRGIQDSHSKVWTDPDKEKKIAEREKIGINTSVIPSKGFDLLPLTSDNIGDDSRITEVISRAKAVTDEYKEKTGIDVIELWKNKQFSDRKNPYNDEKSKFVKYLLDGVGYTGVPIHIPSTEGLDVLYRGVSDSKHGAITSKQLIANFLNGDMDLSGANSSNFGRGIYFGTAIQTANRYANEGDNATVLTAYLLNGFKIVEQKDIMESFKYVKREESLAEKFGDELDYYRFVSGSTSMRDKNYEIFAILSGYDGVRAVNGLNTTYLNILNRRKVGVKK